MEKMATKTLMNIAVLLLAISQLVHIATPRQLLTPADATTASSLVVTGYDVSHGHGNGHGHHGATEEKILLDAPRNIPVPSSPQGKRNTSAASLLVTSVSGPSNGFDVSRGHGQGAAEEKVLLDAPRNIPVPSSPQGKRNTSLAASLLVTSVSGPSNGFDVSHGHGHGAAEEKILLDAPRNIPVPSSPQGKRNTTMAASLLVTSVSGPSNGEIATPPSSTEEKVLLDEPNIPVPSSPPPQGK